MADKTIIVEKSPESSPMDAKPDKAGTCSELLDQLEAKTKRDYPELFEEAVSYIHQLRQLLEDTTPDSYDETDIPSSEKTNFPEELMNTSK